MNIFTHRRFNILQAWRIAGPPAPRTITELQRAGAYGSRQSIINAVKRMGKLGLADLSTRDREITFIPRKNLIIRLGGPLPTKD